MNAKVAALAAGFAVSAFFGAGLAMAIDYTVVAPPWRPAPVTTIVREVVTEPAPAATPAHGVPCPTDAVSCTYGKVVIQDPGSDTLVPDGNQFLIEDKNGAPMFWVNLFGMYGGGTEVCTMGLHLQKQACLEPGNNQATVTTGEGTVILYDAKGNAYALTPADIAYLHKLDGGK